MKMSDRNLKAVIKVLHEMTTRGELEQGHKEVIVRGVAEFRRAHRSHNWKKVMKAVDEVARAFLRSKKK